MPKIKFTALVSGMSGKGQGSVFASNNGGSYFRNNTSKTKTKNALNAKRKSLFAEVSGLWRTLSSEQQEAWRNAVSNFIVQNSFGDNRTPTGFEVFTRVNNVRFEQGLGLLADPPTPRALPSLNDLELETPDLFLFMPNIGLLNFNRFQTNEKQFWESTDVLPPASVFGNQFFCVQYDLSSFKQVMNFSSVPKGLLSCPLVDDNEWLLTLEPVSGNMHKVLLVVTGGSGTLNVLTASAEVDISKPFTIGVSMGNTDVDGIQLYVDGKLVITNNNEVGIYTQKDFSGVVKLFHDANVFQTFASCSDFRLYTNVLTSTQKELITAGYLIGDEDWAFQMNQLQPDLTLDNFNTVIGGSFNGTGTGSKDSFLKSFPQNRCPLMKLTTTSNGESGMRVYVYATPCVSFGRTTSAPNKKLLGVFNFESEQEWDVESNWLSKYGAFSPNSYIQFFVQVSDSTTGINNNALGKPPKRRRFKAGAELSGGAY